MQGLFLAPARVRRWRCRRARGWRPPRWRPRNRPTCPSTARAAQPPPGSRRELERELAQAREGGAARLGRGLRRRDRHQAGDPQVLPGERCPRAARGSASGGTPPLLASASAFTCSSTSERRGRAAAARRSSSAPSATRSTLSTTSKSRATSRGLVALQPSDEVQAGQRQPARLEPGVQLGQLGAGLLYVVLAHVREPGCAPPPRSAPPAAPSRPRPASISSGLRPARRAAAAMRSRTAASRLGERLAHAGARADARGAQQRERLLERQADHVRLAALDLLDQAAPDSLRRIGPRLVERLARGDVGAQLAVVGRRACSRSSPPRRVAPRACRWRRAPPR